MYRILVFSWNTQSVNICETLDEKVANSHRNGSYIPCIGQTTLWRYPGYIPDFFPSLVNKIAESDPDVLVFGFQEDRHPGSYFHSHLLKEELPKLGYRLVKRTKLMGVGITSYKGLKEGDMFQRGLRMSIYAKGSLLEHIIQEEVEMRVAMGNNGQSEYVCSSALTRSKGAIASYLILPGIGRIAFICCHLPFNSQNLIDERMKGDRMIRQNELNHSNLCFNSIIQNLVLSNGPRPAHVIYFGDFNYRVSYNGPANELVTKLVNSDRADIQLIYQQHDELLDQMKKENIYSFKEGMDNSGPGFIPTCKMSRLRNNNSAIVPSVWNVGKYDLRMPSWCDRILYADFVDDGYSLKCVYYDRFDAGETMSRSDHAAVISVIDINKKGQM